MPVTNKGPGLTMQISKFVALTASLAALSTVTGCGLSTSSNGTLTLNSSGPRQGAAPGPSPGAAQAVQRQRPVEDFHAISNRAVCTMVITVGKPYSLTIEGEESVLPQITTDVKDGTLSIDLDRNINTNAPIRLLISTPRLDKFSNAGVGQATLSGLQESFLTINESGAGSVTASGRADMLDLTLSGVGNANLKDLKAKAVTALLSGTGSARVSASESLTGTVSGIGKLTYAGNPPKVQKSVTGLGSITAE